MSPRRRRWALKAVLAGLLAATSLSCGRDDNGLSRQAAADLQAGVSRVRAAASAGDRAGAAGHLAGLRSAVDRYRGQGQISAGRAAGVLAAAAEVEARLALLAPPIPPAATDTSTTTTVRSAPAKPDDAEENDERGKKGGEKKKDDEE